MFGGEMDEMGGDGFFKDIKKGYNRKVKNSDLGKALRGTARSAISDGYDRGAEELGKYKYGKPVSQYVRNKKGSNVDKLTGYTGLGLRLAGDGKFKSAVVKHGRGLRMSGGECQACNGSGMMNDKFLFGDIAL